MVLKVLEELVAAAASLSPEEVEGLDFLPSVSTEARQELVGLGWWHVLFFGDDDGVEYGLRILPHLEWREWPVVSVRHKATAVTFASSLGLFLPLVKFYWANHDRDIFIELRDAWSATEALWRRFHEILRGDNSKLQRLKAFLQDDANTPSERSTEAARSDRLSRFWLQLDQSPEHRFLRTTLSSLVEDTEKIPELPGDDYGIWETRLSNIAAARAFLNQDAPGADSAMWRGYIQSDGYDPESGFCSQLADEGLDAYMGTYDIAALMASPHFPKAHQVLSDPLFPSMLELVDTGVESYTGQGHLIAATELEEGSHSPIRAWHALVSGSYWAGRNAPSMIKPALDSGILLCEKSGWTTAAEVLRYNRRFLR